MSRETHQMSVKRTTGRGGIVLVTLALLVGACGGDSETGASDGSPTMPQSGQTTTSTAATPPETSLEGATATMVPPLDLAGTSWVITHYTEPGGAFTNTLGDAALAFEADGTVTGSTGCNEFAGTWETTGPYYDYDDQAESFEDKIDSQPLTIAVEPTTAVECDGFLGDQDTDVLADLNGTDIWFIGSAFGDETSGITLFGEDTRVFADPA